jgi:flagellin
MSSISSTVLNGHLSYYLDKSIQNYQDCMEQLSSGSKISSAGSNPVDKSNSAALEVSINFNSQIQSNISTGDDLLATAEGYQENIIENISRIRDLTVEAANGTYSSEDKDSILKEIRARLEYVNSISTSANYNGINLLDGSATDLSFKIGMGTDDSVEVGSGLIDVSTTALNINLDSSITGENWTSDDIATYLNNIDDAITTITNASAKLGAYQNRLSYTSDNLTSLTENLTQYKSDISDTDTAQTSADLVKYQILQEATVSILVQANQINQLKYSLINASS